MNQRGRLEGLNELPPDLKESVEQALSTRTASCFAGLNRMVHWRRKFAKWTRDAKYVCAVGAQGMLWLKLIDRRFAGGR